MPTETTDSRISKGSLPLVSVIIPAYRIARYLPEALESVFRQTYPSYEVIVVDQDMDDAMREALEPYRDRVTHITLSPPNVSAARNLAIRNSNGEIFANLDGDDAWEDHALETLVGMLIKDPHTDCVFGASRRLGGTTGDSLHIAHRIPVTHPFTYERLVVRKTGVPGVVVCRRAAFDRIGGYDEAVRYGEDFDFALRLLLNGATINNTRTFTYRTRVRPDSATAGPRIPQLGALLRVHLKHLVLPEVTASSRALHRYMIRKIQCEIELLRGKRAIHDTDYREAAYCFWQSFRLQPNIQVGLAALGLYAFPWLAGPRLQEKIKPLGPG